MYDWCISKDIIGINSFKNDKINIEINTNLLHNGASRMKSNE